MFINIDLETNEIRGVYNSIPEGIVEEYLKTYIEIEDFDIDFEKGRYFYDNNKLVEVKHPLGLVKPVFDYNQLKWIETATPEETEENVRREEVRFYNQELEFASKAVAELKCDIISPEDFEDVKVYMQSIDPYAQTYKFRDKKTRPDIFNRYQ
ncbi:MAG: hypothetical protein ACRCXX_11830 [Cetobacterium sp.]|uniref:hypothetical protein n=1 Tax=Cetobacterium sp. TaxID=2071632 RepID=UPI003F2BC337